MILKALGTIDILIAILMVLVGFHVVMPSALIWTCIIILLVKSVPFIFTADLGSYIDIGCALLLLLSLWITFLPIALFILGALVIAQKGIFSFFS